MAAADKHDETSAMGVWLEIDLDSEPISGSIRAEDDTPKPFVGWLGLTAVLETLRRNGVATRPAHMGPGGVVQRLTRAEHDIVELVCDGLTNPQIAHRLSVSPRTIQGHLLNVFRKLKVSTRAELVAQILRAQMSDAMAANAPSGSQASGSATETLTTTDPHRVEEDRPQTEGKWR